MKDALIEAIGEAISEMLSNDTSVMEVVSLADRLGGDFETQLDAIPEDNEVMELIDEIHGEAADHIKGWICGALDQGDFVITQLARLDGITKEYITGDDMDLFSHYLDCSANDTDRMTKLLRLLHAADDDD